MRKLAIFCLCLALLLCGGLGVWAAEGGLLTLGRAPAGNNETAAREAATQDAIHRAVSRAALEMVDPQALRGHMDVLEREVLSKPSRFVTNFALQASHRGEGQQLVILSLSLDRAALEKALASLGGKQAPAASGGGPLTLVLVAEEASPGRPPVFWWSETPGLEPAPAPLAKALAAAGRRLVEPKALAGKIPPEAKTAVLSESQALELGRACGASLVILGGLRSYPLVSPPGENPPPAAQLMALALPGGQSLATVEMVGPVYHATPGPEANPAMRAVAEQAALKLLEQVAAAPPASPPAQASLELHISGLRHLADRYQFEEKVGGLTSLVGEMRKQSLAGGQATYRLKLAAPAAKLADQLVLMDFGGFVVNVLESTPERISLMLLPKGGAPPAPAAPTPPAIAPTPPAAPAIAPASAAPYAPREAPRVEPGQP